MKATEKRPIIESNYFYHLKIDEQGVIIDANSKLRNQISFLSESISEESIENMLHPEDYTLFQSRTENAMRENEASFTMEMRVKTIEENEFKWTRWEFQLIQSPASQFRMIGFGHDILNDAVKKTVSIPVLKSEKKKSSKRKEKKSIGILEQQSEFLKKLTFNQSHLMRSKLANIIGILEVIQPQNNPEEIPELIAILKDEAQKLDTALQESIHSSSSMNTKFRRPTD
ncbi:PAS domain-containing protein [Belliella kenyensis]|uniref:PAS domain-containing protein n=1 Tax=Belliella kenyensis TaxID=1472724 RepID=A0ABV8ELN2_9BACT|nr:PAS domain-containing protein [Belliella kenyensis]MCH7400627.1 PAS domain-containing protein [Belliella kenyensis]MDN3602086.1 PAS domain-containing protein [Belliella kenyensis]